MNFSTSILFLFPDPALHLIVVSLLRLLQPVAVPWCVFAFCGLDGHCVGGWRFLVTGVRLCVFGKDAAGGVLGPQRIESWGAHIGMFFLLHWVFVAVHGLSCPLACGMLVP